MVSFRQPTLRQDRCGGLTTRRREQLHCTVIHGFKPVQEAFPFGEFLVAKKLKRAGTQTTAILYYRRVFRATHDIVLTRVNPTLNQHSPLQITLVSCP